MVFIAVLLSLERAAQMINKNPLHLRNGVKENDPVPVCYPQGQDR